MYLINFCDLRVLVLIIFCRYVILNIIVIGLLKIFFIWQHKFLLMEIQVYRVVTLQST